MRPGGWPVLHDLDPVVLPVAIQETLMITGSLVLALSEQPYLHAVIDGANYNFFWSCHQQYCDRSASRRFSRRRDSAL
jgi:hypothetical protein